MSRFKERKLGYVELNAPGGAVGKAVGRAAGKVRDDAKRIITSEGRVNTGAMRQGVKSEMLVTTADKTIWRISGSTDHDMYQHEGVGPFGPRRAKVLRFTPKGGSVAIFRPRSSGFAGIHFLTRALDQLGVKDFDL